MAEWQWEKEKLSKCFPALAQQTASESTGSTLYQGKDLLALITAIKTTTTITPTIPSLGKAGEKQDESKGMSRSELNNTLQICWKASTGDMMDLPAWMQESATKGTSEHYKSIIIQKYGMSNTFYDDANVCFTAPFLRTIIKKACTGKDGNINRPSLLHAMDGLSPFTMLVLNKDEVALMNNEDDLINSASLVNVADLRQRLKQQKVCIPAEADGLMLMLKRYANLVYEIFQIPAHLSKC